MGDIYDEINEKYYKDDNKPVNPIFKVIGIIFLVVLVLFILFTSFRCINLKHNLKKYYQEKFTIKEYKLFPVSDVVFEKMTIYGERPKKVLYSFFVKDSKDEIYSGFADAFGNVYLDDYADTYYHNEMKKYFMETVDFEHDYPDLSLYVMDFHMPRYVLTKECTSFEGYLHSSLVMEYTCTGGYPNMRAVLDTKDYDTVTSMKKKLRKADFPIYTEFINVSPISEDMKDTDVYNAYEYEMGIYFPFGERYDIATMGVDKVKYAEAFWETYENDNKVVATVQITENNKVQTNYILYGDGTLEKRDYDDSTSDSYTTSTAKLNGEDYIDLEWFFAGNYADIHQTVKDDSADSDLKANLYLHRGKWIWGLIELDHLDSDFDLDFERVDFDYCTDENPARKLYSVKKDNEEIKPVIDIIEKYFD